MLTCLMGTVLASLRDCPLRLCNREFGFQLLDLVLIAVPQLRAYEQVPLVHLPQPHDLQFLGGV